MTADLIHLIPPPALPVPAAVRTRRWIEGEGVLAYRDVRLRLSIETDAETCACSLFWRVQMPNGKWLPAPLGPLRLDYSHQVHVVPRAIRFSPAGVCLGVLLELRATRIDRLPVLCEVSYG